MSVAFDPEKDASNIAKHGISLARAVEMDMAAAFVREDDRFDYVKRGTSRSARLRMSFTVSSSPFAAAGSVPSAFARRTKERSGAMTAKPKFDPELHEENPEWTERDFAKAKPAPEILPSEVIAQFRNKGGRPRIENPKQAVKLRIDADVLAKFRESGPGWQTRINGILRAALSAHASRAEAKATAKRMMPMPASGKKQTHPKIAGKSARQTEKRHHA